MRAKLRTWIGSWRVWVIVACLAYIGGIYWQAPRIAAIWPRGVWIAVGLALAAGVFVCWMVTSYILVPLFTRLGAKKFDERTDKAKEKWADSLMSCGTSVLGAFITSILVFPLTAFIQAVTSGTDPVAVVVSWWPPAWWSEWHTAVFISLYFLPLMLSALFRGRALNIYDELPPSAPAVAPTAQGTREQTTISDPGPPPYTSTTGGTRRRRRPHGK